MKAIPKQYKSNMKATWSSRCKVKLQVTPTPPPSRWGEDVDVI